MGNAFILLVALVGCAVEGDVGAGSEHYDRTCASCHGPDGTAGVQVNGVAASDLTKLTPSLSDRALTTVIQDGKGEMPAQGLDDEETADCLAYLRESFGE